MKINTDSMLFNPNQILSIEGTRNWKYVCETCLKGPTGWINQPFALFWSDVAHPEGSNYAALYYNANDDLMVTDGISATKDDFTGVVGLDGVVYFSRYRNDFREIPGGFVDGGRDYLRLGRNICSAERITLKIIQDKVVPIVDTVVIADQLQLEYQT